jgi:hypothetical protein
MQKEGGCTLNDHVQQTNDEVGEVCRRINIVQNTKDDCNSIVQCIPLDTRLSIPVRAISAIRLSLK